MSSFLFFIFPVFCSYPSHTCLARDVIAACWWSFPLILAEESKFIGVKYVLRKVLSSEAPPNGI